VPKNASVSFAESILKSQKKRKNGGVSDSPEQDPRKAEVMRGYHEFIKKPQPIEEYESSRKDYNTPKRQRSLIKIEGTNLKIDIN